MKIIQDKKKLKVLIHKEKNLGFVPTMGAIHKGHLSLFEKSISQCKKTIVSIYVNKPQFNKKDDFKKYPRVLKNDVSKLKKLKIDYLYIPKTNQIYPNGINKKIKIHSFGKKLCGKFRPKHFRAVADVIDRFIKIIKPSRIYFGEKDMQQLKIITNFIGQNYKNIKVIGCRTIREKNGLPYSSRNLLLSSEEKNISSKIYQIIKKSKNNLLKSKIKLNPLKQKIYKLGVKKIDYIEIFDINKIIKPYIKKNKYKIFIAYYIGNTRLIDNI